MGKPASGGDDFPSKAGDRYRQYYFFREGGNPARRWPLENCMTNWWKGADLLLKTVQAMEAGAIRWPTSVDCCGGAKPRSEDIQKKTWKSVGTGKLETICNHIRGLSPFPGMDGITGCPGRIAECWHLKYLKAARIRQSHNLQRGSPYRWKNLWCICGRGGIVRVLELQLL